MINLAYQQIKAAAATRHLRPAIYRKRGKQRIYFDVGSTAKAFLEFNRPVTYRQPPQLKRDLLANAEMVVVNTASDIDNMDARIKERKIKHAVLTALQHAARTLQIDSPSMADMDIPDWRPTEADWQSDAIL